MHLIASNWILWLADPANWLIVLAVAGGLGFVIFVHELGHFLVAKACGVKCEKFYIGFDIYGLKLCKFQWGETEYGIGIFPLGGYVKMLGQDDNPANRAEETRRARVNTSQATSSEHAPVLTHGDLPPEPVSDPHEPYDPRSYMAQSVPKRMAIISAGVIMNVIFAIIMSTVAYALGVPETPCIVGGASAGGAAWQSNLEPGDRITQIAGVENPRFRDLQTNVTLGDVDKGVPFTVDRAANDKLENIVLHPDSSLGVPMIGITSAAEPKLIDRAGSRPAMKFSPAKQASPEFKAGDTIVQINDMPIHSYRDVDRALARYVDEPIQVTVERAVAKGASKDEKSGDKVEISVQPAPMRDFGMVMALGPITAVQKNSPAANAGLEVGDRIVSVAGQPIGDPFLLESRLRKLAVDGKPVSVQFERKFDGKAETRAVDVTLRKPEFTDVIQTNSPLPLNSLGVTSQVPTAVAAVRPGSPAAGAGIQPGDEIVSEKLLSPPKREAGAADDDEAPPATTVAFEKLLSWPGYVLKILPTLDPETKVQFQVKRGDKTNRVELAMEELKSDSGKVLHSPDRGFNFSPTTITRKAQTWGEAVRAGVAETGDSLSMVFRFLKKIGGQIPVTMLSGPVGIIQQAGFEAQQGFAKFLLFLTLLSANLAVVNFLPIPVLDGGHMVFLLYEGLRGKPASERIIVSFTYAGLVFLLSLMLFVLALDTGLISRL